MITLECRTEVAHVILRAKPDKEIPELEIYIGDQLTPTQPIDFRQAGRARDIDAQESRQVQTFGIGTHLMFVFPKPSKEQFFGNGRVGSMASH